MANQTLDALRASDARLRHAQDRLQGFSGVWRVVPQGLQLDMSYIAGYVPRILTWSEMSATAIGDLDKMFVAAEDWAFDALEVKRPTDETM